MSKSDSKQPLRGVRVLVGRARHQAGALSSELRRLGARVVEIPFIEIRKPRSFRALDNALRNLDSYDWLILTSVNGVDAMWARMEKLQLATKDRDREGSWLTRAASSAGNSSGLAAARRRLRVAAIGPATRKAIEQRQLKVDVVPKEYVAESVVRSLKGRVKGMRVLLVRAKVARDVIPRELRRAGAQVDVIEAYETVVPKSSRVRLQAALKNPRRRPHVVTFTSSSTVRNFVELMGIPPGRRSAALAGVRTASIGPVTSSTLGELGLSVDIRAKEFTIPGLLDAIVRSTLKK
ncbi:MAG TPA: uroporphyrinogen-III synthase [Verrucomicrobiae bacterium]|nr:uroporphyrinogen-III synthase [Verrucomicrobiae bacterium]